MEGKAVKPRCMKPIALPSPDGLAPNGPMLRTGYSVLTSTRRCNHSPTLLSAKIASYLRSATISRVACSIPTKSARETMEWPMFSSTSFGSARIGFTFT